MESVLRAVAAHPRLTLQIVATGMHLSRQHGRTIDEIHSEWPVDRVVAWSGSSSPVDLARATGLAMSRLATAFDELQSDIVLVVGDRVEAFAAASAAHLSGRIVAHVHGGDRAAGQVDDSLRHAITKIAHIHFPATVSSAARIARLGEDPLRIHQVGSPGIDEIERAAASRSAVAGEIGQLSLGRYALLLLHPVDADESLEERRAGMIARAVQTVPFPQVVVIYPNNDPGSAGIIRAWSGAGKKFILRPSVSRPIFLGLLRDAAVLVGNSSSGIIEAASFQTPVIDIGPRQLGRESGENVTHVPYASRAVREALRTIWNDGNPLRVAGKNIYGGRGTGKRIAAILGRVALKQPLSRKLIAY